MARREMKEGDQEGKPISVAGGDMGAEGDVYILHHRISCHPRGTSGWRWPLSGACSVNFSMTSTKSYDKARDDTPQVRITYIDTQLRYAAHRRAPCIGSSQNTPG
jgi:hypothetical protein